MGPIAYTDKRKGISAIYRTREAWFKEEYDVGITALNERGSCQCRMS